jgi:cyclase
MMKHLFNCKALALLLIFPSLLANAQDYDNVKIKVIPANNNVYMLKGAGGNIGLLSSAKGLVLIDDQFAPLAERIETAMQGVSKQPLKYIINTHFHGDHTGSNSFFSHQAPIFAHENVRSRLLNEGKKSEFLPEITYQNGIVIYLEDEKIQLTHYPKAHTDSDTVVYFKKANVLHTGDLFFEIGFPYIDLKRGGSVKGYLAAVRKIIVQMPDDVVIIPGHGKLSNKTRYQEFAEMIAYSITRVSQFLAQGKTEQEILALGIGEDYQQWAWQFITEEFWLKTLIADLK